MSYQQALTCTKDNTDNTGDGTVGGLGTCKRPAAIQPNANTDCPLGYHFVPPGYICVKDVTATPPSNQFEVRPKPKFDTGKLTTPKRCR
jgi:hypothetical protein